MSKITHQIQTKAKPADIWRLWVDVKNWHTWNDTVEYSALDGWFVRGVKGYIKPKNGLRFEFVLSQVKDGEGFSYTVNLPFGLMVVRHFIKIEKRKTYLVQEVEFSGVSRVVLMNSVGKKYAKTLPRIMEKFKYLAEKKVAAS